MIGMITAIICIKAIIPIMYLIAIYIFYIKVNGLCKEKKQSIFLFCIIRVTLIIRIMVQVTALHWTLEFQESAKCKGHFASHMQGSFCSVQLFGAGSHQIQRSSMENDLFAAIIQHSLRNRFEGAPGDRWKGSGDGRRMWFVNLWALGCSCDM
jgi:hypothetical protein